MKKLHQENKKLPQVISSNEEQLEERTITDIVSEIGKELSVYPKPGTTITDYVSELGEAVEIKPEPNDTLTSYVEKIKNH